MQIITRKLARQIEPLLKYREDQLERSGKWKEAQRLRKKQHQLRGLSDQKWDTLKEFMRLEFFGCYLVQHETFLLGERQNLDKSIVAGPEKAELGKLQEKLVDIQGQLESINKNLWRHLLGIHRFEVEFEGEPLLRALRSHRRNEKWYLSDWLRWHCAGSGGYCSRDCGCCQKPRSTRANGMGHCTVACVCCHRHRGFKIDIPKGETDPKKIDPAYKGYR